MASGSSSPRKISASVVTPCAASKRWPARRLSGRARSLSVEFDAVGGRFGCDDPHRRERCRARVPDRDRTAGQARIRDRFAQARFDRRFAIDVVEEHAAARAAHATFARNGLADAGAARARIDEETPVLREHVRDVAHHARVLRRTAALVVVHAARLREFGQVIGDLAANRRVAHTRRDRPGAGIDAGCRLHRQMQHHALAGGARVAGDGAAEADVRQNR